MTEPLTIQPPQWLLDHHPWCNHFMRPREGCKMCEGLYERYPPQADDKRGDLMARHFPQNVMREGT